MVKAAIEKSGDPSDMLAYTFSAIQNNVRNQDFRDDILRTILEIYQVEQDGWDHDYYKIMRCQFLLDQPLDTAELLLKLVQSEREDDYLTGYQLGFDLVDNES